MTSAVPGHPCTDPDPDPDLYQAGHAEMDACLARLAELQAAALERTLADIRRK